MYINVTKGDLQSVPRPYGIPRYFKMYKRIFLYLYVLLTVNSSHFLNN